MFIKLSLSGKDFAYDSEKSLLTLNNFVLFKGSNFFLIRIAFQQAKRTLKNLTIQVSPSNSEHKITGLSGKPCEDQM